MMNLPLKILITGTNKGIGIPASQSQCLNLRDKPIEAISRVLTMEINRQEQPRQMQGLGCSFQGQYRKIYRRKEQRSIFSLITQASANQNSRIPISTIHSTQSNAYTLGPINLTESIIHLLSDTCKVVNVSSMFGGLKFQPIQTQEKFSNSSLTQSDILQAIEEYIKETQNKIFLNFNCNAYSTSKMFLGAWSRFVLQKNLLKGKQISICVTPGLCLTPMTKNTPPQVKAKAHSAQSGALKIHETIFLPDLDANVFYHRARKTNFITNGEELQWI